MPDIIKVAILGTEPPDGSVLELAEFVPGRRIDTQVIFYAETAGIQGWSFGVRHDAESLALIETTLTTAGTQVEALSRQLSFERTEALPGGYVSAVVLSLLAESFLPAGRNPVCNASYTLVSNPGADGALIRFVDGELGVPGSPPVEISVVVHGVNGLPEIACDGLVRVRGTARPSFIRGDIDADGAINLTDAIALLQVLLGGHDRPLDCVAASDADADGTVNLTDAIVLLNWLFRRGPPLHEPFPVCGTAPADATGCRESSPGCEN